MRAHEFKDVLQKSDIVIHTIGTLIDSSVLKNKKPYFTKNNLEASKALMNKWIEIQL